MEPKIMLDIGLKVLAVLTLIFGAVFYAMKIVYRLVPFMKNGNGKKQQPDCPRPGEDEICKSHQDSITKIEAILPRIDRAVTAIHKKMFGVDPS